MLKAIWKRLLPPGLRRWLLDATEFLYRDFEGVVVAKPIANLPEKDLWHTANAGDVEIFEVSAGTNAERYTSLLRRADGTLGTRRARACLRSGFRGFAAVRDGRVVGAVWSVLPAESRVRGIHEDLHMLGLRLAADEAYMFNMYIEPEHRGLALCTALFRAGFRAMRARGVATVKGYYVRDNKPALWMHRMAGYREVGRVRVRQTLGFAWSYEYVSLAGPERVADGSRAHQAGVTAG